MSTTTAAPAVPGHDWTPRHLLALLVANAALALGAWFVRLSDTGPVAAGFWRLSLALPVLVLLAAREPAAQRRMGPGLLALVIGAGVFFALDLAAWHFGIVRTKLGNASLFGNSGSLIVMVWGLFVARRAPRVLEIAAIAAALGGAGLLMGGSLEISHDNLVGDLFCLLGGLFYAFYIIMLNGARERLGQYSLLAVSTAASVPVMLLVAVLLGETIWPHNWTPLIALAISSQLIGQGFLIYSLRHFTPLVIGLALMTQPALTATVGWLAFGETLSALDVLGMVLLAAALMLAKAGDKPSGKA
ncbi:DMT family transporter [Novosphingobium sp. AP12]|uniref:DMT family transporter n=1 Tax=Novosphingobium sp. AP12 TaxID=1144305 RepID=UPI0002721FA9|nr:DMT family transporter [Novosphingobium sp. AP12]EJL20722.1 putative permease, DMT superfamily [Novosphingobium sp. AP12]